MTVHGSGTGVVQALAAGCLAVGFVIGMLIFGKPWHLPAAWGDIPTWFLAFCATITAWFAALAFQEQSREVSAIEQQVRDARQLARQQTELLRLQADQLKLQAEQLVLQAEQLDLIREQQSDQRALNAQQGEVLKCQADELRESLAERQREVELRPHAR